MPQMNEFYFTSSTGGNRIRVREWCPDHEPKAVIQIAHGIAEHVERYDDFMRFLAENGYVAVANDHLGHGKSVTSEDELGFFAETNGWDYVVADIDKLHNYMADRYPKIPYVHFGHSMGSFLTRTYLFRHPDKYDAAIISGTGMQAPSVVLAGYTMAQLMTKLQGAKHDGTLLNNIAFGAYNKAYENPRTAFDWLSRNEAEVDKYIADPLCGFIAKVGLFRDMMYGIRLISDRKNIAKMNKTSPVLFMSGDMDPVGENGVGVTRAYQAFCDAGLQDVYLKLYKDGRHEMLNEINKDEVYTDILTWLKEKVG